MASTPLGNEIDRVRALLGSTIESHRQLGIENAQLKRALEVLAQHTAVAAKCPPGQRDKCTLVSEINCHGSAAELLGSQDLQPRCKECLRDWAMDKAKTDTLETPYR
jgi:hypothetical protein